jgi:ATP-dependent helicase/nuclease subunit A
MSPTAPGMLFDEAKMAQRRAGDPRRSVWVSANAGSGKTRVLVDRVARLLLAGAKPSAILCLTFTKAAAAEMRGRLAKRLGAWASMGDPALRDDLADLAGPDLAVDAELLGRARRLFAETLDAPGGMRVQTIHSFCESLLKRFPIEAKLGVSFAIADDGDTAELLAAARDRLLASAHSDPVVGEALSHIVAQVDSLQLDEVLKALAADRRRLRRLIAGHDGDVEGVVAALAVALGVAPGTTPESLAADFAAAVPAADLRRACKALARGTDKDLERGEEIQFLIDGGDFAGAFDSWRAIFLTQKDEIRDAKNLATQKVQKTDGEALAILQREAARCVAQLERLRAVALHRASAAMLRLGARLMALYDAGKRAHGLLDYDDLIFRSLDLLEDVDASWVRFKLDGGVDHVLVDEAQDTSDEQWRLVGALTEEFFAGEGARAETVRTLFAVGDEKQSIFSFQGADPRAFAQARASFARGGIDVSGTFDVVELAFSFRSTPTVLAAVDTLFAQAIAREGVAADATLHRALRDGEPGLVELWPLVKPPERGEETAWDAPLDYRLRDVAPGRARATHRDATIAGWLKRGETLAATGEPIRAADVMILVRRRNVFFTEMVRALKAHDVPVAGADRLVLADHIAVQDLVALGAFVLLPRDDYTLACVLKSPLCGLDDDDLIALCPSRSGGLWDALRARAGEKESWAAAVADLERWLAAADFSPPFEFYARLLGADGGRRRFLARLGNEAADPLDEFLALALAFEHEHAPSLQAFLHWFARGGAVIKRDMEQARDEVRVMTVHAAKGLEAPIVFLPDTTAEPGTRNDPKLFWIDDAGRNPRLLLWPGRKADDAPLSRETRERLMALRLEEYRRLLYVAATRARDRLYVCGWTGKDPAKDTAWHRLVETGLRTHPDLREVDLPWSGEKALRLAPDAPPRAPAVAQKPATPPVATLPDWAQRAPRAEPRPPRPLAPSSVEGELAAGAPVSGGARNRRAQRPGPAPALRAPAHGRRRGARRGRAPPGGACAARARAGRRRRHGRRGASGHGDAAGAVRSG